MTNAPVTIITDEQIDELEGFLAEAESLGPMTDCETVQALISRLRAAEMDAGRYRFIRDTDELPMNLMRLDMMGDSLDAEVDAAMEQSK